MRPGAGQGRRVPAPRRKAITRLPLLTCDSFQPMQAVGKDGLASQRDRKRRKVRRLCEGPCFKLPQITDEDRNWRGEDEDAGAPQHDDVSIKYALSPHAAWAGSFLSRASSGPASRHR